ncbi:hypothetical protein FRB93_011777 [Tulasnella sp. JGI-2019a]|nr:hypothetical protein FRB93_011777 [Tulasnella sp. JGI-2019a]
MFELCILLVACAALYYHVDIIGTSVSAVPLDGPGDHSQADTDDLAVPVYTPSPQITHHIKPAPPAYHYDAPQQSTTCPICYPPSPRVFPPINPNPKYVPLVHSSDCPLQPRWVYSRRPQSNPTAHNASPYRFTTDDLIDLRQVHRGDPDFDPTAPLVSSSPARPIHIAHTITPPLAPRNHFISQFPDRRPTSTYAHTPPITNPYPSYPSTPNYTPTPANNPAHQTSILKQDEPLSEQVLQHRPIWHAMDVDLAPPSTPIDISSPMEIEPAPTSTPTTDTVAMEVESIPPATSMTDIIPDTESFNSMGDIIMDNMTTSIIDEDINMTDPSTSIEYNEDTDLIDPEDVMDYDEDVIFTDVEDEDSIMVDEASDAKTRLEGVCQQLAELSIADVSALDDDAMVIWN